MSRKIYIPQDSLTVLAENTVNESLSQRAYHFTDLKSYYMMLYNDAIMLSPIERNVENSVFDNHGSAKYYLSTTRVRDSRFGYSSLGLRNVRLELDSDALNANYKAKPVSFFQTFSDDDSSVKNYYAHKGKTFNDTVKTQTEVENEDRIFFNKPRLQNIPKYVTRADILIDTPDDKIAMMPYKERDVWTLLKEILTLSNMWTRTFVYNDRQKFDVQGENITQRLFETF